MANKKEITIKVQLDGTKGVVKDSAKIQHSVRDIGDEAEKTGKRADKGFGMAGIAAGALAAGALTELSNMARQAVMQSYRLATSAEETGSKFQRVLGPSIGEANAYLEENSHLMGLSQQQGQSMLATTTAIAQGFDFTGDEAAQMGIEVMKLAGDLQSFNDVPIEQTHNAITSALAGEREALKSLGIVIRETDVQERAFLQTGKESADALTQQEKATATMSLITERAGKAVGDLAATQDSTANKARRAAAEYRTLAENFSKLLLPAFDSGVNLALGMAEGLNDMIEVPVVEELQAQKNEFNALYTQATSVNTSQQERVRLIRQMKQEYPEFLEGIDAEKVSNEELHGVLQRVNEEYDDRIDIQQILTPVQQAYNKAKQSSEKAHQQESKLLIWLEKLYRTNKDQLEKLGFETENFRDKLQNMSVREASEELNVLTQALENNLSAERARQNVAQSGAAQFNKTIITLRAAETYEQSLAQAREEARTQLENLGFSQERINELMVKYNLESDQAEQHTKDWNDTLQFMSDLMSGNLYSGLDEVSSGTSSLSEKMKTNKDRINELINKTGTLTQAERNEVKSLAAQNRGYQRQIDKRKELLDLPTEQQISIEQQGIDEFQTLGGLSDETISQDEINKNQQKIAAKERERQKNEEIAASLRMVEGAEISVAEAAGLAGEQGKEAGEKTAKGFQSAAEHTMAAAAAQIAMADSAAEAANQVIDTIIAEIVAYAIRSAMASLPFPANIVAAAGAAAAGKGMAALIPEFAEGGIPDGPTHAQGGMIGLIGGRPAFEFEGGEAIINTRSTALFRDELSAINQAGGGRRFPGARMADGGPLGPLPNRPEGGIPSRSGGFDTAALASAVQQGMENATVVARLRDSIADIDDKLTNYREEQNLIGN